jgi:hypothetical protein
LKSTPSRLALEWQFEEQGAANPFTGWKGRWLAVRVPTDAHVSSIKLRVSEPMRVSVKRDGTKLKDASLSGDSVIPIDGPGGDYRIEVLGEPRTISDLDVLGQAGTQREAIGSLPTARQGSLDIGEHLSGPWPSLDAYCEKRGGDRCKESGARARDRDGDWFATKTKRGWFVLKDVKEIEPQTERVEKTLDAGASSVSFIHVDRAEVGSGFRGEALKTFVVATRELVVCRFVDDYPDCEERHVLGKWEGEVGLGNVHFDGGRDPFPPPSGKWHEPKAPRFLSDGGVVAE